MSDYDEAMYCPTCHARQMFNFSGSGTKAICFVCGKEVRGKEIERLRDASVFDFLFAPMSNKVDK